MAEVFLAKKRGAEGTYKLLVVKRILPDHGHPRRAAFARCSSTRRSSRRASITRTSSRSTSSPTTATRGTSSSMEYVEGCDLGHAHERARRRKATRIPPWVGAWIIAEAAKGLHYAHEKKDEGGAPLEIVHRDVSPQNVLLSFEGVVKIADFGIASAQALPDEEAGVLKGKFGYMSPEQARGEKVDRRSDLYALGVILWELPDRASAPRRARRRGAARHRALGQRRAAEHVRARHPRRSSRRSSMKRARARARGALPDGARRRGAIGARCSCEAGARRRVDARGDASRSSSRASAGSDRASPSPPEHHAAGRRAACAAPRRATSRAVERSTRRRAPQRSESADAAHPRRRRPRRRRGARGAARRGRHAAARTASSELDRRAATRRSPRARSSASRAMLGDIAYKRGMRCGSGRATTRRARSPGSRANPARAAADAAWLAVDTHEAIAGVKEDLPAADRRVDRHRARHRVGHARSAQGNLVRYALHEPATYLADVARARDAARSARGSRAASIASCAAIFAGATRRRSSSPNAATSVQNVPPTMRIYALERSLSREEQARGERERAAAISSGATPRRPSSTAAYHARGERRGRRRHGRRRRAIVGEMGIGKTALVATFLAELPPNARLVRAECSPVRMEVPFSAARGSRARRDRRDAATSRSTRSRDLIARAGGGAAQRRRDEPDRGAPRRARDEPRRWRDGDDEDAHYRKKLVVSGVRHLARAPSRSRSRSSLVVEGLQWADKPSLELARRAPARRAIRCPILVVLVTRPDDRVAPLLEGMVRIELRGLSTRRAGAPRRGAPRRARGRAAGLRRARAARRRQPVLPARDGRRAARARRRSRSARSPATTARRDSVRADASATAPCSCRRRSSSSSAIASRELPGREHVVVDWLAIAGGPLAVDRSREARAADPTRTPSCASARAGSAIARATSSTSATRSRATSPTRRSTPTSASRMHRALGEHLADDVARARPLGGDRRAPPRARRGGRARGRASTSRPRHAARNGVPDAARDSLLPARSRCTSPPTIRGSSIAARGARGASSASSAGGASACATSRRCGASRASDRHAARRVPRAPAHGALRPRRGHLAHGLPVAQARRRDRARARRCRSSRSRPRRS